MGGGVFFVKSGPFLNAGCVMYSISIFYFTFYLFGGAYAPNAPPCLLAWIGIGDMYSRCPRPRYLSLTVSPAKKLNRADFSGTVKLKTAKVRRPSD